MDPVLICNVHVNKKISVIVILVPVSNLKTACLMVSHQKLTLLYTSNWASELVTIRKIEANHNVTYNHVLLTFEFETAVKPTAIEYSSVLSGALVFHT